MSSVDILFLSTSCAILDIAHHIATAGETGVQEQAEMPKALSLYREGDKVYIHKIAGSGAFKRRLLDLGFQRGKQLSIVKYAPLKDPMEVELSGNHISLRVEEARHIEVDTERPVLH